MKWSVTIQGPDGETVHQPVKLQTRSVGSLTMWPVNEKSEPNLDAVRVMENVWHVFFDTGYLEIEGVECRDDGTLVHCRWEATPLGFSDEDRELLKVVFGDDEKKSGQG